MGNEMGNSNVSGLTTAAEEERSPVEAPERSLGNAHIHDQEDGEAKGGNGVVHETLLASTHPDGSAKADGSDVENKMVSDDGVSHVGNKATSNECNGSSCVSTDEEMSACEGPERTTDNDHVEDEAKGENRAVDDNVSLVSPDDPAKANVSHEENKIISDDDEQEARDEVVNEHLVSDQSENGKPIDSNLDGTCGHPIQKQVSLEQGGIEDVPEHAVKSDFCRKELDDTELEASVECKEDRDEPMNTTAFSELSSVHKKPEDPKPEEHVQLGMSEDHQIQKQGDRHSDDQHNKGEILDEVKVAEEDLCLITSEESKVNDLDVETLSASVISDDRKIDDVQQVHELTREENILLEVNDYKEKGEMLVVYESHNDSEEVMSANSTALEDKEKNSDCLMDSTQLALESEEKVMIYVDDENNSVSKESDGNEENKYGSNRVLACEQETGTDMDQIIDDEKGKEDKLESVDTDQLSAQPEVVDDMLRKSPSFDFDIPFEARHEESDQTLLLHHDVAETRSSLSANVVAECVEEKTIRVERSDSDHKPMRTPFLSLLQKEENASVLVAPQEEERTVEVVTIITSSERSGRRRTRTSLFGTCICCATTIR